MDIYMEKWLNEKFEELNSSIDNLAKNIEKMHLNITELEKHNIKCPRIKVEQIEAETELIRFFTKNKFIAGCVVIGFIFLIGLEFYRIVK